MGYGHTIPKTFFKITNGKISVKNPADGTESAYNFFEGYLRSIAYIEKEVEYNGKKILMKSYNVSFVDEPDQESEHIWSAHPKSLIFQSFINCILNVTDFRTTKIKLSPYLKNNQQRISIYANGKRLDWKYQINQMPPIDPILGKNGQPMKDVNGNPLWDYTARLEWIQEKVDYITTLIDNNDYYETAINNDEEVNDLDF